MSKTIKANMEDTPKHPDQDSIAARAYERWRQRGFPEGSAEEDWLEAERELDMSEAERIEAA
ncbi:MAG TPA: DUF2934 domain-containing protein [Bryobacteraceae bacterium]